MFTCEKMRGQRLATAPLDLGLSADHPRHEAVISYRRVERKQMTCSTSARSSTFGGKQKHQMRVTHSAWASTIPGTPRSGPRLPILLAGVAVSVRVESDASRAKWRRATNVCSVGHRKVEKELSMRCRKAVLLAKRLHETGATLTVEAEKGNLWNIDTGPH